MNENGVEYKKKYQIIRPSVVKEIAHGVTVSNLASRVARQMKLSDEICYDLTIAGFLHDIGKLELAKYVHEKIDNTLTIEEMRYTRAHANLGALILQEKGYSQEIVNMVKCHHENCDGSGYPKNLVREDIPLGARIIRVCDVFAALTADRSYRKAFDAETAIELMIEEAKYYDIQVFLAFLNMIHSEDMEYLMDTTEVQRKLTQYIEQIGTADFEIIN